MKKLRNKTPPILPLTSTSKKGHKNYEAFTTKIIDITKSLLL